MLQTCCVVLSPLQMAPASSYPFPGGFRGMFPNFDVTLILEALTAMGQGTVTLRDFAAFNPPSSRVDYPLGLITALPWFAGLNRYAVTLNNDGILRSLLQFPECPLHTCSLALCYVRILQQAGVIRPSPSASVEHDLCRT